jgi:tetratricopeptide (TPR) repeat protein
MNAFDLLEKLSGIWAKWRTRQGYVLILALLIGAAKLVSELFPSHALLIATVITTTLTWTLAWVYATARIVFPSRKPTIAFCFEVELEGENTYRKLIRKIQRQLAELTLDRAIRVLHVGEGVIQNLKDAERYAARYGIRQVVWGVAEYGSIQHEEMLKFDVKHFMAFDQLVEQNLQLLRRDYAILRAGRPFTIKNSDNLVDLQVVADDFLEISLGLVGIQALIAGANADAVKILSLVVGTLQAKTIANVADTRKMQVRRLTELLHGAMIRLAIDSHTNGEHSTAVALLQQLLPAYSKNIDIRLTTARALFYLGDLKGAVQQTNEIIKIDRANPAAFANQAFFAIRKRKYDDAGKWYERLRISKRALTVSLETVTKFLDERYEEDPDEHAYLFGLAIVNGLDDPEAMRVDLLEFLQKTQDRPEYHPLRKRASLLVAEKQGKVDGVRSKE